MLGSIHAAFDAAPPACELAVDMPIGFAAGAATRACDDLARRALGPRRASVFAPPVRAVLDASDHGEANARSKALTGRGLSIQAFHLMPRIREVDRWLRGDAAPVNRVFECHPELAFARFAGAPMTHPKRTLSGRRERLDLLESRAPGTSEVVDALLASTRRSDVAADDAIDACVLALVAALPPAQRENVPSEVPTDGVGLPMRIVVPARVEEPAPIEEPAQVDGADRARRR